MSKSLDAAIATIAKKKSDIEDAVMEALDEVAWPISTPLPEELTAEQRRLADALATRSGLRCLSSVAIPHAVQSRRRWLGVDSPGVLERRHDFKHEGKKVSWPLWKIWKVGGEKALHATVKKPLERVQAYVDGSPDLPYGPVKTSMFTDAIEALGKDGGDWATQLLDEGSRWYVIKQGRVENVKPKEGGFEKSEPVSLVSSRTACAALFVAIARAGREVKPEWEILFPMTNHVFISEIAAAIPDDRREASLLAAADRGVRKDALFALFDLWPEYRYPSWTKWIDDELVKAGKDGTEWRKAWAKLNKPAPKKKR